MGGGGGLSTEPGEANCFANGAAATCDLATEMCCFVDPGFDGCEPRSAGCQCNGPGCVTTEIRCDGSEDCPGGETCCGLFDQMNQSYTELSCQPSCGGPNELEICHDGDPCQDPGYTCSNSQYLPEYIFRCFM
jgi:hypothetical protein